MTHFTAMFTSFQCSGTAPTLRDDCTSFLLGKQVIVCSGSFNVDIKMNESVAKTDAPEGG